jgi:hypothetical protein
VVEKRSRCSYQASGWGDEASSDQAYRSENPGREIMSDTHVVLGEVLKIVREYAVVKASSLPSLMEHVYD